MASKPAHRRGTYHVASRQIRQAANANSNTKCWRCGLTLSEHAPHHDGKPAKWTAGHLRDGDPLSPMMPEASTCNYSAGARGKASRTTRRW